MATLSSRMKKLRKKHELTQKDMAKSLKISRQAYNHYESGKREPSYTALIKLAKYFNVSLDYLIGISNIENPYKDNKELEKNSLFEEIEKSSKQYQNENKIGCILKLLRKNEGLTQDNLAKLLNVKRQTYSAWERNITEPDLKTIKLLSDYYGIPVDYLLDKAHSNNLLNDKEVKHMPIFSKRLKKLRKEYNEISTEKLTGAKLGKIVGVSKQSISKWENGLSYPDFDTLIKLANFFDISTDYLVGKVNTRKSYINNQLTLKTNENILLQNIKSLSKESQKELEKYIELLKIKDQIHKNKSTFLHI